MSLKRKKETLDEELEELKLTKYGCGLKLTGFTSMLGWAGMIIATVTTIGALTVFAFLIDTARLGIDICRKGGLQESGDFSTSGLYGRFWHSGGLTCGISIGFGLFFFILSPYWFYLSYQLRNKVQEHDLVGITRTLKIICYIQAAFSIILYGPLMVFPILLIIGMARRRTVFVKIFIIFITCDDYSDKCRKYWNLHVLGSYEGIWILLSLWSYLQYWIHVALCLCQWSHHRASQHHGTSRQQVQVRSIQEQSDTS